MMNNINIRKLIRQLCLIPVNIVFFDLNNLVENLFDIYEELELNQTRENTIGLFVLKSVKLAIKMLFDDNKYLFTTEIPKPNNLQDLFKKLDEKLTHTEIDLETLFHKPRDLSFLGDVQKAFEAWVEPIIKDRTQTENLCQKLPNYFIDALLNEWTNHPDDYQSLINELNNPFFALKKQQEEWNSYFKNLQKELEKSILLENFSLKEIYIPLRAYYEEELPDISDPYVASVRNSDLKSHKPKRVVIDLAKELESWLIQANPKDAIRLVTGSPGSGKSSFAKIFAARQAELGRKVLLIPLQKKYFNLRDNLIESINDFFKNFTQNPLDSSNYNVLLIFDGLDELSQQGPIATQVAKEFMNKVSYAVSFFNREKEPTKGCFQVIILGREGVIQEQEDFFGFKKKEIIYLLPYVLNESQRNQHRYEDSQNLISEDQRKIWWKKYAQLKGKENKAFPKAFNEEDLLDITAQPLHNLLFAIYSEHNNIDLNSINISDHLSINDIYFNLLQTIYENDSDRHQQIKAMGKRYFDRILMEIAFAAWCRSSLNITVNEIDEYLEMQNNDFIRNQLQELQNFYQENQSSILIRKLVILYCRPEHGLRGFEDTFEFTHNSFGLYLTARKIVEALLNIIKRLSDSESDNYFDTYNIRDALNQWIHLFCFSSIDDYLCKFILGEISKLEDSYRSGKIEFGAEHLQERLCTFIEYVMKQGMPINNLQLTTFRDEMEKSKNAEIALLIILNCCTQVTKKIAEIKHHEPESFGEWIARLIGQRRGRSWEDVPILNCLSYLNLQKCNLKLRDFYKADLAKTSLASSDLEFAYLNQANLEGAELSKSNLRGARLWGANLNKAILKEADLPMASFSAATLIDADLEDANLEGANLVEANLTKAILVRADLTKANLEDANLEGANLVEANLTKAILVGADLTKANLEDANLVGADLTGANLTGANLTGTILEGKDIDE